MSDLSFIFCMWCTLVAVSHGRLIKQNTNGCPDTSGIITTCIFDPRWNCLSSVDSQCPEGYRCCPYGCGSRCLAVTDHFQHPGTCPTDLSGTDTASSCTLDQNCKTHEKCCSGYCVEVRPFAVPVNNLLS